MKKYIAIGLVLAMMVGVAGCDTATDNMDMLAQIMATADQITTAAVDPNSQGDQGAIENGDNGEAAGAKENPNEDTEKNGNGMGNDSANNAPAANKSSNNQGSQQRNQAAGNAQVNNSGGNNNSSGNNNAQAKPNNNQAANNSTQKVNNQAQANNSTPKPNNQAQNKPASNNSDKKDETTKATTTVKKKKGYYVCNGCGHKTPSANGSGAIRAHLKEQSKKYFAGNDAAGKCGSYRTSWE